MLVSIEWQSASKGGRHHERTGTPARSRARRWWALGAVMLAVLAVGLDATVLSVALPTLATQLHASESDLQCSPPDTCWCWRP